MGKDFRECLSSSLCSLIGLVASLESTVGALLLVADLPDPIPVVVAVLIAEQLTVWFHRAFFLLFFLLIPSEFCIFSQPINGNIPTKMESQFSMT